MRLSVFYGSFMRGHPGHANLKGARFVRAVETAKRYRLFSMGAYPALLPVEENGIAVLGELYDVPDDVWARVLAAEPPELVAGEVELSDGSVVDCMFAADAGTVEGALDISAYGGWTSYVSAKGA